MLWSKLQLKMCFKNTLPYFIFVRLESEIKIAAHIFIIKAF